MIQTKEEELINFSLMSKIIKDYFFKLSKLEKNEDLSLELFTSNANNLLETTIREIESFDNKPFFKTPSFTITNIKKELNEKLYFSIKRKEKEGI